MTDTGMINTTPGLMMQAQLLTSSMLQHVEKVHGTREIYSRNTDGSEHRYTWADCAKRARKLANALIAAGVKPGDRVATIAWNNYRHIEIYFAVSGIGAIVHTINPRLDPKQIVWMINHAEDSYVFFDQTFAPIIEATAGNCPSLKECILLEDASKLGDINAKAQDYETFIGSASDELDWPQFDENSACSLCYTSGTTGDPKGALYSHRSSILHAMAAAVPDSMDLRSADTVLAVVPMFHVNAWGLSYSAAMTGAKLVMPGPMLDGASLATMINQEKVTLMAGVPTVWLGVYQYAKENGIKFETPRKAIVGGSAVPEALLRAYEQELGIPLCQGWGMTEMSPLGAIYSPLPENVDADYDDEVKYKLYAGRRIYGVDMRIVDDEDNILPEDGKTSGHLQVRGPWVVSSYFKGVGAEAFTDDGWFRTGDVSVLHPEGYMEITDRSKDVIKSGGEWISSIEVENAAMDHPDVAMAACFGVAHEKWQERPFLVVQPVPGKHPDESEIQQCILNKCAKWWLPDGMVFVESLPLGATGKILKRELKVQYENVYLTK